MTSRSEEAGEKRPFCVTPHRAIIDRQLKTQELRTLMALGYYANRAGVCWPSLETLSKDTGMDTASLSRAVSKLQELGYIRRLEPNDYNQKKGAWGYSNRYQLMWRGDEPAPTYEQVADANLMQAALDRDAPEEGSGARGPTDEQRHHMRRLEAAWQAATEAVNGVRLVTPAPAAELLALAEAGVDPVALRSAAEAEIRRRTAARLGFPTFQAVAALALGGGVQDPSGRLAPVHGTAAPSGE